jgi:hypothetical protein
LKRFFGKAIGIFSSLRLSVVCLFYCVVIVICGTFYQVDNGLFAAQERFFRSWILLIAGCVPLPGLQTVLAIVLLNVLISGIKRISFQFAKIGLLLMHCGVIVLIGGTGLSSRFVKESVLTIAKNQRMEQSIDLKHWDLSISLSGVEDGALWSSSRNFPLSAIKPGHSLKLPQTNKTIVVKRMYKSCQAQGRRVGAIDSLIPLSPSSEGGNIPGLVLSYGNVPQTDNNPEMMVYGGAGEPRQYLRLGDTLSIALMPQWVKLPLKIALVDFILEKHLGTSQAKKIQSRIHVSGEGIDREVIVSMNRPFRYHSYTFYQTGFSDDNGLRTSQLTVVENPVRFLPHSASVLIIAGLLFHFCFRMIVALQSTRRKQNG